VQSITVPKIEEKALTAKSPVGHSCHIIKTGDNFPLEVAKQFAGRRVEGC
jgi:hypothetical protein